MAKPVLVELLRFIAANEQLPRTLQRYSGYDRDTLGKLINAAADRIEEAEKAREAAAPGGSKGIKVRKQTDVEKAAARSAAELDEAMDLSKAELEPFLAATGTLPMLRKEGNLQVYESEAELKASLPGWRARAEHGIEFRHMGAAEMAEIQPGLAPRFTHGTFTPGWYSIADPKLYTLALADHFRAKGGTIERAYVTALKPVDGGKAVLKIPARGFGIYREQ